MNGHSEWGGVSEEFVAQNTRSHQPALALLLLLAEKFCEVSEQNEVDLAAGW